MKRADELRWLYRMDSRHQYLPLYSYKPRALYSKWEAWGCIVCLAIIFSVLWWMVGR